MFLCGLKDVDNHASNIYDVGTSCFFQVRANWKAKMYDHIAKCNNVCAVLGHSHSAMYASQMKYSKASGRVLAVEQQQVTSNGGLKVEKDGVE
jgi:hypothetical protein